MSADEEHVDEPLVSVVYTSRASEPMTDVDLAALLALSRRNNAERGLTGMLLYREESFLQVLEGPRRQVWDQMSIIELDHRHSDIHVLIAEPVRTRQFADWSMAYPSPAVTAAADAHPDADGAPGYRRSFDDLYRSTAPGHTETALRELTRWFRARLDTAQAAED